MNAFKKLVGQFFLAERHVTSCHNIARRQPEGPPLGQGWPGASRGTRLNQNRSGLLKAKRGAPWHLKMGDPPFLASFSGLLNRYQVLGYVSPPPFPWASILWKGDQNRQQMLPCVPSTKISVANRHTNSFGLLSTTFNESHWADSHISAACWTARGSREGHNDPIKD